MEAETLKPGADERSTRLGTLLGSIGILGYLWWASHGGLVRAGNWVGVDFHVYYQTAQVILRGGNLYHAGIAPPYVYPPFLALLVTLLAALSGQAATICWKLLQHLCLLGAGTLLLRLLPPRVRPVAAGIFLLGALTVPLHDEIQTGESNSLVLLLEAGAVYLVARTNGPAGGAISGRLVAAGVLLGVAASIKVLPLLLIGYFWFRGPRPGALAAAGTFVTLQAVSLLLTPDTAEYWLVHFPALFGQAFPFLDNQSLNAALSRALLPPPPGMPPLQILNVPDLREALTWVANLVVLGTTLIALGRRAAVPLPRLPDGERRTVELLLEVGLVLFTIHLISGSTWLHHLVDLIVPAAGLLAAWMRLRKHSTEAEGPATLGKGAGLRVPILAAALPMVVFLARPEEWVAWVSGVVPNTALLLWMASNAGLWIVLGGWLLTLKALHAIQPASLV